MENEGKDSLGTTNAEAFDAAASPSIPTNSADADAPSTPRQIFSSPDLAAPTALTAPLPTDPFHPVRSVGSGQGDVVLGGNKPTINKKIIFIALGAVTLIGAIALIVALFSRGRTTDSVAAIGEINTTLIFDQSAPIPLSLDGNYGYLNPEDGSTLINPRFLVAERFYGDYALAKTGSEDNIMQTLVINRAGETIFSFEGDNTETYYDSENNYWLIDGDLYDAQMKKFSPENTISNYINNGYVLVKTAAQKTNPEASQQNASTSASKTQPTNSADASDTQADNVGASFSTVSDEISYTGASYITNLDGKKVYDCGESCAAFTVKADGVVYAVVRVPGQNSRIVNLSDASVIYTAGGSISLRDGSLVERQSKTSSKYLRIQSNQVVTLAHPETISASTLSHSGEFIVETCKASSKNSATKYSLKTTNGETIVDCSIDEYYELSPSLYTAYRQKFNKSPVIILRDGTLQLFDMSKKQVIATYEAQSARVFEESPFVQLINLETSKEQVCNILAGEKDNCLTLKEDNHSVAGYANYFIVDNTDEQHFYNATLKEIR